MMPQFDVYTVTQAGDMVVDVQHRLLDGMATRVVIPLSLDQNQKIDIMNPLIRVKDQDYILLTLAITSIKTKQLMHLVDNIDDQRHAILSAMDRVFSGI
jgi:toxin CcdB